MANIISTVKAVQQGDVTFKAAQIAHPALSGKVLYRELGGMLEVSCQVKLGEAVTSGAVLCTIPTSCVPAIGLMYRYTSDADTAPDVRQCKISSTGVISNTSGLAFNVGYTMVFSVTTPLQ